MKYLRIIIVSIGWFTIGISMLLYIAACGIAWLGECLIRTGTGEELCGQ